MAGTTAKKRTAAKGSTAPAKKKTTGKTRSQGTKPQAAARNPVTQTQETQAPESANPQILREAALWLVLAVCILMFISYLGVGGYIGAAVSDFSFGVFGITAYLFPFLLFIAAAFLISNRGNRIAGLKFASSLGLYLCICSFAALFTKECRDITEITELYEHSASYKDGGGVIGGGICALLRPALGDLGTGIVLLILAIIFLVLITQKSLMRGMKRQGSRMYQSAKESGERRREARRREREQRSDWDLPEELLGAADTDASCLQTQGQMLQDASWTSEKESTSGRRKKKETQPAHREPQPSGQRTEIDVPVLFPVSSREHRTGRRAVGVTMDTRIEGDPRRVGTEIHEVIPKAGSGRPERGGRRQRESVIELGRGTQAEHAPEEPAGLEYYHDASGLRPDLHIEGIGVSSEETPAVSGSADLTSGKRTETKGKAQGGSEAPHEEPTGVTAYRDTAGMTAHGEPAGATAHGEMAGASAHAASAIGNMPYEGVDDDALYGMAEEESPYGTADLDASYGTVSSGKAALGKAAAMGTADAGTHAGKTPHDRADAGTHAGRTPHDRAEAGDAADGGVDAETQSEHSGAARRNPRSTQKEIEEGIASVEAEMAKTAEQIQPEYVYPPLDLLKKGRNSTGGNQEQEIRATAAKLQQTLNSFGVHATVTNVSRGPSVTRYELQPEQGVKVSRIVGLSDDIKLNLAAADIRIEAPIPGKAAVGIEVPNGENSAVALRDLLESDEFRNHPSKLAFATGKDIGGKVVVSDIAKMPHLLIAGATGSGKSVCINTLIISLLYKASPDEVKLIMIDPKVVELSVYNGIPHLFIPVVTDPKKAAGALNWGVAEMTDRYNKFAELGVRDLKGYNQRIEALKDVEDENKPKKLPQIVIIVDELADLMMVAPGEVEDSICRLAQLARAAGIHLIIATQRPSVNVITGLIKANMPSRIAFSVSSGVDSRTIIDMNGAEKLLGKGDMLFYPQGYQKPARVQGAFVSDEEVADVVDFLKNKNTSVAYDAQMEEQIARVQQAVSAAKGGEDMDALFADAGKFIIDKDKASIGMLQRVFKIGFNRAARIMDQLSDAGVVGPEEGTKPRKILMSAEEFENYLEQN